MTNQKHYLDLESTCHRYGISALFHRRLFTGKPVIASRNWVFGVQSSFCGKTGGGVARNVGRAFFSGSNKKANLPLARLKLYYFLEDDFP